jgi:hypothetical protein
MTVVNHDKATQVGLLISYYITLSFWSAQMLALSMISRNVAGQTKKSTVVATNFVAWSVGNAIGQSCIYSDEFLLTLDRSSSLLDLECPSLLHCICSTPGLLQSPCCSYCISSLVFASWESQEGGTCTSGYSRGNGCTVCSRFWGSNRQREP